MPGSFKMKITGLIKKYWRIPVLAILTSNAVVDVLLGAIAFRLRHFFLVMVLALAFAVLAMLATKLIKDFAGTDMR